MKRWRVQRGGAKKDWIHSSFSEGRCNYCGLAIVTTNTTVKKNHLLNPRSCSFLHSQDAANTPDTEVVLVLECLRAQQPEYQIRMNVLTPAVTSMDRKAFKNSVINSKEDLSEAEQHSSCDTGHPGDVNSVRHSVTSSLLGSSFFCMRPRSRFYQIDEAEALVQTLKQKLCGLEGENAMLRAREAVFTRGVDVAENVMRLVRLHQAGLSRQAVYLHHSEMQRQASFDAVPPPWEWTPAWLHRLATMDVDAVRYMILTFKQLAEQLVERALLRGLGQIQKGSLECLQQKQAVLGEISAKGYAVFFYLVTTNHMAILGNTNVYLNGETGQRDAPDEQCYMSHAKELLPLLGDDKNTLNAIREGLSVFKRRMSQLKYLRAGLKRQLSGQTTSRSLEGSAIPTVVSVGSLTCTEQCQQQERDARAISTDKTPSCVISDQADPVKLSGMEDTLRGIILDGVKYAVRGDPDGARGGLGDMELRGADIHLMELLLMDDKDGGDTTHKETALTPGSLSNGGEGNPSVSQVNLTSSGGPGGTMGGDMVNPAVSRVSMTIGSLAQSSSSCSSSNRRRPEIRFEDGIQTYDIVKQLLRSFQQEAFERMAFNAVLHRVLNFEAEVCLFMHPYWPDRPKLMEYVMMYVDQGIRE